jgi:hypothetical protein
VPQRFEATWNFKLVAAIVSLLLVMIAVAAGTDSAVPSIWRGVYVIGALTGLATCWRWARSHCVIDGDGLTVVGVVRKRRFVADELTGAEVDLRGVPALVLTGGRSVRLGFLSALFGSQRQRAADFAVAVNDLARSPK